MDDVGDQAPAAAMGMLIVLTSAIVKLLHCVLMKATNRRANAWRMRARN